MALLWFVPAVAVPGDFLNKANAVSGIIDNIPPETMQKIQNSNNQSQTNDNTTTKSDDSGDDDEIQTIEIDTDYYDVLNIVSELGWCPDDGSESHNARKAEICKKISQVESLDDELDENMTALEANYKNMQDKEKSFENRMLGGLTMAATGIGGMELARGLAEQSADKAAEADMQAYLATFQCRIGDAGGKSYKGGEMGIEVSGGNQLTSLYQQYVDLAADLKERKTALGMAPGIESTVVMDKANMGLYDATGGSGVENGTYASLYRASRGNAADQQKLAEQKDTSSTRVKAGAIAAGAGAVAGMVGNYAINHDNKDKSSELLAQRQEIRANLKSRFNEIAEQLIQECNTLIQEHKDYAQTLTPEQLSNPELAEYKQAVDDAQPITDIMEIKDSKFCK